MGICHLCQETPPDAELLDHLRVMHPDAYADGPQRWPDGGLVIVDETVEPGDFAPGGGSA
jgi:hypothetical protein